jgi:hypothetical protein
MDLHRCLRLLVDSHARDNEQNANKKNLVVGARVWLAVSLTVTAWCLNSTDEAQLFKMRHEYVLG